MVMRVGCGVAILRRRGVGVVCGSVVVGMGVGVLGVCWVGVVVVRVSGLVLRVGLVVVCCVVLGVV